MADNAMKWEKYGKKSYKALGNHFRLEINLDNDKTFSFDLKAASWDYLVSIVCIKNIDDLEMEINNEIEGLLDELRSIKCLASQIHTLKFGKGAT